MKRETNRLQAIQKRLKLLRCEPLARLRRWGCSYQEIGDSIGVTRERARQLVKYFEEYKED